LLNDLGNDAGGIWPTQPGPTDTDATTRAWVPLLAVGCGTATRGDHLSFWPLIRSL